MKLHQINKIYHNKNNTVQALYDISLEIHHTGMIFIVGPSGCGKTTLAHIMNGQDKHYTGVFECEGTVEYIEQQICLFENMSVFDNLKLVCEHEEKIQRYLKQFSMQSYAKKKVKHLSIGQKKRVQIIRSLLVGFDYLLLDEPTAALDEANTKIIMEMLKELSQNHSIIMITHEDHLNERYADRTISMKKGNIIQDCMHHETSS